MYEITISERTLKYALHVLDAQRQNAIDRPKDKGQKEYYDGMMTMFDILVSEGHTNGNMSVWNGAAHYLRIKD